MVTEVDHASERLIAQRIAAARPDDAIVGEEGAERSGSSPFRWIVDPLDGTTNYLYRHPGFAVSIAIERAGKTVAGVVCDPIHDDLFEAVLGSGATRNGAAIEPTGARELSKALVATGFSYEATERAEQGGVVAHVLPRIRDIRRMGAAAVDLCSVACGRVDGFYERGLKPWDMAAGALIAAEAGAEVGVLEAEGVIAGTVLATTPAIFTDLRALLLEAGGGE